MLRSRRLWGVLVVALLLLAAVAWAVLQSPLLAVRTVQVTGVPAAAVAAVRDRADVPGGVPLARIDTAAVAARALAPDLESVTVRRSYPSTLVIRAVRRVAVLAVRNSQGQVEVWDRHGIAFGTAPTAPAGIPLLDGGRSRLNSVSVASVTAVLQSLPASLRARASDVVVTASGMVSFRLGHLSVDWGDASDPALKVRVLSVLEHKAHSGIDLSVPRTPAVR